MIRRILSQRKNTKKPDKSYLDYGRFSELNRNFKNNPIWENSLVAFSDSDFRKTVKYLLLYLQNEDSNNITIEEQGPVLKFTLLQGSMKISGFSDQLVFKATVKIGKIQTYNVGFMRRILERNYFLQYCRYTVDPEDGISLVFDSPISIASPFKLYQGLREMALTADQDDDLFADEFDEITQIKDDHISYFTEAEVKTKTQYLRQQIESLINDLEFGGKVMHRNPGTVAYLTLDLAYKLDYLLQPQAFVLKCIQNIHQIFFFNNELNLERKVHLMLRELKQIIERSDEKLTKEFYNGTYTFGAAQNYTSEGISNFIKSELPAMPWYISNNQKEAAMAVPGFIIGYLLFQFNLPGPLQYLFHIFYELKEESFFDFNISLENKMVTLEKINQKILVKKLKDAMKICIEMYESWNLQIERINIENKLLFSKTLLEAISDIKWTMKEQ
jgi:hypothetical protein